jgi:hypothetical protein
LRLNILQLYSFTPREDTHEIANKSDTPLLNFVNRIGSLGLRFWTSALVTKVKREQSLHCNMKKAAYC